MLFLFSGGFKYHDIPRVVFQAERTLRGRGAGPVGRGGRERRTSSDDAAVEGEYLSV